MSFNTSSLTLTEKAYFIAAMQPSIYKDSINFNSAIKVEIEEEEDAYMIIVPFLNNITKYYSMLRLNGNHIFDSSAITTYESIIGTGSQIGVKFEVVDPLTNYFVSIERNANTGIITIDVIENPLINAGSLVGMYGCRI